MTKHKKKHNKSSGAPAAGAAAVTKGPQQQQPDPVPGTAVNVAAKSSTPQQPPPTPSSSPQQPPTPVLPDKKVIAGSGSVAMAPSNDNKVGGVRSGATVAPVLTAVKTLLKVIENYNGTTVNGLISELRSANATYAATLGSQVQTKSRLAVSSACLQFIRYATLTLSSIEAEDVSKCREQMLSEGLKYLRRCETSIDKISRWAVTLIFDGARILVHSDSLVVLETLRSVPKNIYFSVFIVIDNDSVKSYFKDNYNIDVKTIRDAEVGTLMESMDLVMVGAEAVLKNGGIINKVGTLSLAICANEMNKPMYVLAESFKFSLMYPMNQQDLPKEIREDSTGERIRVDYTLPKYITFLVTDRGLLTPTAVCDELIELYT